MVGYGGKDLQKRKVLSLETDGSTVSLHFLKEFCFTFLKIVSISQIILASLTTGSIKTWSMTFSVSDCYNSHTAVSQVRSWVRWPIGSAVVSSASSAASLLVYSLPLVNFHPTSTSWSSHTASWEVSCWRCFYAVIIRRYHIEYHFRRLCLIKNDPPPSDSDLGIGPHRIRVPEDLNTTYKKVKQKINIWHKLNHMFVTSYELVQITFFCCSATRISVYMLALETQLHIPTIFEIRSRVSSPWDWKSYFWLLRNFWTLSIDSHWFIIGCERKRKEGEREVYLPST